MTEHVTTETNALPEVVREHLGRELRSTYAANAEKPRYLGDPTIPPVLAEQVVRLEGRLKAHEEGTEAVKDALATIVEGDLGDDLDGVREPDGR